MNLYVHELDNGKYAVTVDFEESYCFQMIRDKAYPELDDGEMGEYYVEEEHSKLIASAEISRQVYIHDEKPEKLLSLIRDYNGSKILEVCAVK